MPAEITPDTVRHIARLARLQLSDAEAVAFAPQLSRILEYVDQLGALDTSAVAPLNHPIELFDVTRADEPAPTLGADAALRNAPATIEGHFRVPKVLDSGA
ncbi:MAG: Asp-tRNA(Asn)/Glu-tRNA(Gln) amidotransferase subunit GatC [Phycisphaerales bacterium]|nr:Asp-tRNA(Asn)/Glu-tRNA(Gln) amidotransferase subunit GatC [Phycisphaerales bacterium]